MNAPPTLPALTSIRFFAALAVVFFHNRIFQSGLAGQVCGIGYVAVPFFFMLSGFILGYVYLWSEKPIDTRHFFASRVARVYPLYVVALLLDLPHYVHTRMLAIQSSSHRVTAVFLSCLTLVQSWTNHPPGLNGPAWSLSVAVIYYLLFPVLGVLLWRISRRWLLPVGLLVLLGGVVLLVLTHGLYEVSYDPWRHLPEFVLGILLSRFAFLYTRSSQAQRQLARWSAATMVLAAAAIVAASYLWRYAGLLQHDLLIPVFAAVILVCTVPYGWVYRVLSHPKLVLLGKASYAMYLLHTPIKPFFRVVMEQHPVIGVPTYLAFVICISIAAYVFFERPARLWLMRVMGAPCASPAHRRPSAPQAS